VYKQFLHLYLFAVLLCAILQETLLHLAEKHSSQTVISTLIQLYRDANLLQDVLCHKNDQQCNPLRQSIQNGHFENTVLLFKECLLVAKDAITTVDTNGMVVHVLSLM